MFIQGVIKPDVVFFGEQLSDSFWLFPTHMERADLVVVMGTSLEVCYSYDVPVHIGYTQNIIYT